MKQMKVSGLVKLGPDVSFKVDYHAGTGRRTLKTRARGETNYRDCDGPLFGNSDAGVFYRAVAALLSEHHSAGGCVEYIDTALDSVEG